MVIIIVIIFSVLTVAGQLLFPLHAHRRPAKQKQRAETTLIANFFFFFFLDHDFLVLPKVGGAAAAPLPVCVHVSSPRASPPFLLTLLQSRARFFFTERMENAASGTLSNNEAVK